MIGPSRSYQVWAYPAPADMRKGFNGLYALVVNSMQLDPLSGDCFLFTNRRRTTSKTLLWDGTGLCIYQKRLSKGRFAKLWGASLGQPVELSPSELSLFLEGAALTGRLPLSPKKMHFES